MSDVEYAVWIMPDKRTASEASGIISLLGKKYGSPEFVPHVTLIALKGTEKEIIKNTSILLRKTKSFEISLSEISYKNEFFRCLFVKAEKTRDLMDLNRKAQKIFSAGDAYMPHLSLMYGKFPAKLKKEIISGLGEKFSGSFVARRICLIRVESPDPKDWHVVRRFKL